MSKRINYLELNNVKFERVKNVRGTRTYRTLYECYTRPSDIKRDIYDYWRRYFYFNDWNVHWFGVYSFNTQMFTITAQTEKDGIIYTFYITPNYNYVMVSDWNF